jgi:peptide/nickel transport system permease protein
MAKFLQQRGIKKLRKDRLAVWSMWIIGLYLLVALVVLIGNSKLFADGDWKLATEERVGPDNHPGFWGSQDREERLSDISFYFDTLEKASQGSDPGAAYAALSWGADRLPDWDAAKIEAEILAPAREVNEQLESIEDLDADPTALAKIERLDELVRGRIGASHDADGNASSSFGQQFRMFLGTDRQGRSILLRGIYSTKVAVQIGVVAALISVLIGTILGAAAGYFGGVVDVIVVWLYSTFSSIPWIVLLMVIASAFRGTSLDNTLWPVYAAFCLSFWISPCRVVRGEVMKLKELEYVQAASAIGFGRMRILFKHVIPNTAHLMFINFSLLFIGAIKAEVILSFLGLGVKNEPSWGVMINHAKAEVLNGFFWQIGTATVFMVILVLAFNTLSDALQDAFDPKHV